jgi:hypothetical protein
MTCAFDRLFAGAILLLLWPYFSYNLWAQQISELNPGSLELSGAAVPSRFVHAVGEKAGLWGFENGVLEGWVYPLKIFHDFKLAFQIEGSPTVYAGEQLIRAVRVRPESVDLQYSAERFTVTETLFTPRHEPGFAILLRARGSAPLRVFVRLRPDLNLMWPGAVGGQTAAWDSKNRRMALSEPSDNFSALIGSPAATTSSAVGYHAYLTNEQPYEQIELRLEAKATQSDLVPIIVAGGIRNSYDPVAIYERLLARLPDIYSESVKHYADLDAGGPKIFTPDPAVNSALRWSRISLAQLKICNPYAGCGFVSGYGSSGTGTRPMYAWFFDEPNITERAFVEVGSIESMREAFRFIQKFQRSDGQIPHEISQSEGLIDWFNKYPYPYIHSDTALWYLIAMAHFYRFTGDRAFLNESWSSIRKAYAFCVSLLNAENGLPQIPPENWGSIETAGVAVQDSAMAGEWIAALHGMADLAEAMHNPSLAQECRNRGKLASDSLEKIFWNPANGYYSYGIGRSGEKVNYLNPAIAYSAWFGGLSRAHSRAVSERLATAQFLSDWGERSMSLEDPRYDENSYQVGSAWPFFTAPAIIADYQNHNAIQGFTTWTSMTRLRMSNARGAMPESLSGSFYRLLDNGVPHQMFSELNAVPGLVEGVLGLDVDVPHNAIRLAPHLPPAWPRVVVREFPYGQGQISFQLRQAPERLTADLEVTGIAPTELVFSPALPAGATPYSVRVEGKPIHFQQEDTGSDIHVTVKLNRVSKTTVEILYRGGVGVDVPWQPILEGDSSRNLHVLESSYQNGQFQLLVEGRPDLEYEVRLWTPWRIATAKSSQSITNDGEWRILRISAPPDASEQRDKAGFVRWKITATMAPH